MTGPYYFGALPRGWINREAWKRRARRLVSGKDAHNIFCDYHRNGGVLWQHVHVGRTAVSVLQMNTIVSRHYLVYFPTGRLPLIEKLSNPLKRYLSLFRLSGNLREDVYLVKKSTSYGNDELSKCLLLPGISQCLAAKCKGGAQAFNSNRTCRNLDIGREVDVPQGLPMDLNNKASETEGCFRSFIAFDCPRNVHSHWAPSYTIGLEPCPALGLNSRRSVSGYSIALKKRGKTVGGNELYYLKLKLNVGGRFSICNGSFVESYSTGSKDFKQPSLLKAILNIHTDEIRCVRLLGKSADGFMKFAMKQKSETKLTDIGGAYFKPVPKNRTDFDINLERKNFYYEINENMIPLYQNRHDVIWRTKLLSKGYGASCDTKSLHCFLQMRFFSSKKPSDNDVLNSSDNGRCSPCDATLNAYNGRNDNFPFDSHVNLVNDKPVAEVVLEPAWRFGGGPKSSRINHKGENSRIGSKRFALRGFNHLDRKGTAGSDKGNCPEEAAAAALDYIEMARDTFSHAPDASSEAEKTTKARSRWDSLQTDTLDPSETVERILYAERVMEGVVDAENEIDENVYTESDANGEGGERDSESSHSTSPDEAFVPVPCRKDLWLLTFAGGIPFLGFGFTDNFVMIIAGDLFDTTLCVSLGLSTMAAAALGNWLSDLLGIWLGSWMESMIARLKHIPRPSLTKEQLELGVSRRFYYLGSAIGMSVGCLLGMIPLFFLDTKEGARLKKQREEESFIFVELMQQLEEYLQAEKVVFYRVDPVAGCFRTILDGRLIEIPLDAGIPGEAYNTGKLINWRPSHADEAKSQLLMATPTLQQQFQPTKTQLCQSSEDTNSHFAKEKTGDKMPKEHSKSTPQTEPVVALQGECQGPAHSVMGLEEVGERPTTVFPRDERAGERLQSTQILGAPVFGFQGDIIGVVEVLNPVGRSQFSRRDKELLLNICSHLAVEFEGKQHINKILEMCRRQILSRGSSGATKATAP